MGSVGSVHSPFAPFDMNAARPLEAGNFFRDWSWGWGLNFTSFAAALCSEYKIECVGLTELLSYSLMLRLAFATPRCQYIRG